MNIFILNECPITAAQLHCNEHVLKMTIEYAQMLSTAHRVCDGKMYIEISPKGRKIKRWAHSEDTLYKVAHLNHPCTKWVRESKSNYEYMYEMWNELCKEFRRRFLNTHLSETKLIDILANAPKNIPDIGLTPFVQCMPDQYKNIDPIQAYNDFYKYDKLFATYMSKYPFRFQ